MSLSLTTKNTCFTHKVVMFLPLGQLTLLTMTFCLPRSCFQLLTKHYPLKLPCLACCFPLHCVVLFSHVISKKTIDALLFIPSSTAHDKEVMYETLTKTVAYALCSYDCTKLSLALCSIFSIIELKFTVVH